MKKTVLGIALSIALVGCSSMAPPLPPANSNIPGQWSTNGESTQIAILHWSKIFNSPIILRDLNLALAHNKEITQASLNALKAHQLINVVDNPLTLTLSANSDTTGPIYPKCCVTAHNEYGLLSLDFELDVWGRIRSATDSATFSAEAADLTIQSVQSAIQSDVIRAHLTIAYVNEYQTTLNEMERVLDFLIHKAKARTESGLPNSAELSRLLLKKSNILSIRNLINQQKSNSIDALQILTSYTRNEQEYAQNLADLNPQYTSIPQNTSSEVLLNRPDIRAAEKKLQAANADIGVARANRFPKITLSAEALMYSNGNKIWNLFPSIAQVLFDGGRLKSIEDATTTNRDIVLTEYEIAIQKAFRDTSNALNNTGTTSRQVELAEQSQSLAQQAFNRTLKRNTAGYDSLSDLIDRYDDLLTANSQVPKSMFDKAINTVLLFAAIGTQPG